jgi:glycosyltransferase involved in cell wall biosynthesis
MTHNGKSSAPRILYVAYPLLTVSRESAGGAEQVLWTLEREMARRGVESAVAASAGSQVTGELFATGEPCIELDDLERRNLEHQDRIVEFVRRCAREGRPFSLIHDQSGSFWRRAAEVDVSMLATLHLPRSFYPQGYFENVAANVRFNCVSLSQLANFNGLEGLQGVVANGVILDGIENGADFGQSTSPAARSGLLWLGRICEEKAPHLALDIAERAGLPITLAGQIYPFSYHQQYFNREVTPRLEISPTATFSPLPSCDRKRQMLRGARAVLITSQADETSSLVAMEAAAAGTPVVAFARGALPEIVRHGVTGFLADDVQAATAALEGVANIAPADCINHARRHFSSAGMADGYARLYAQVLAEASCSVHPCADR